MTLTRIVLCLALLGSSSFSLAQGPVQSSVVLPPGSAVITDLKGDVLVTSPQESPAAAKVHQVLPANTLVETRKGTVLLTLSDGSQVLVKPNSQIVLRLPSDSKGNFLEELIGKIIAKIQKRLKNEPPFQMGTPSAVITVRGTRFLVEVTRKQHTYVLVYEGIVQVDSVGPLHSPVVLSPGYTTQVGRNEPPEHPTRPLDEIGTGGAESPGPERSDERGRQNQTTGPSDTPDAQETPD